MKRIVVVGIMAVLACALFLVPYTSAAVEITCSVYPEEADFKSDFVYSITLTNPDFLAIGELSLKVGSDSDNRGISGEWNVTEMELEPGSSCVIENWKIRIPKGGSCTVKKGVDFTHPELNQGAFRDWTENPKSPEWDRAWYECCFTPKPEDLGDEVCCEGSGAPILTHCIEEFKEHHVEQNETYENLSFDYYITVWANCKDRIELQVRNYSKTSSSGWDKHVQKNYTVLDVYTNKTLTWHAVNLTIDNFDTKGRGQYKFVGYTNKSQTYSDPRIEERFDDPKVSYKKTINELLSFDYEVSVWVDLVIDSIKLEVYNYSLRDWEQKGIRNYTTPGKSQKLIWTSINLSCDHFEGNPLSGKYRFRGTYKTSSNITGPVIEEKFYTLDVTPKEGTNTDTFNYSVTVNANICDKIELQVKNHTTNHWDSKGTREYRMPDRNETLTWNNIKLNIHELDQFNDSMFRFESTKVGINSSTSTGPFYPLNLNWRNHSVTPNEELHLYDSKFDYCIEVKSTKVIDVKLRVYYPHKGEAEISDNTKSYTRGDRGNWELICWNVTQPFVEADEGNATYKFEFYYKGTRVNETELYPGPLIGIAEFKDASFEPEIGTGETEFTYRVLVRAVKPDNITLTVYDSKGDKVAERISKDKTTTEWKQFVFENVPFKDPPASGIATYEFLTGKNTKMSFDGPELIAEEFGELSVSPKEGTNYILFNFSVDYKTSNPDYVTLWAKCDDGEWVEVERKPVVSEQGTISFRAKTPCETFETVCWKCTGIVSESEINCTNWDIGLKWQSRSFSPKEGWWDDNFGFSVRLSANVPGEVELMVKEEGSNEWVAVGKKLYTDSPNPQTLTWENERLFNNPYEGNTSYNFSFYWGKIGYAALPYPGPKLFIPIDISISSADVIPDESVSYIENEMLQDYFKNLNIPVTFSSSVSAAKDTSIKLVTIDPFGAEREYEAKEYHGPGLKALKWAVESSNFERMGVWAYKFMYIDTRYGWANYREEFKGPEIIAVLRDFDIDPKPPLLYGESCDVTVVVNGSRDLTITLELWNATRCVHYKKKTYNSSKGEDRISWEGIKPWENFTSSDKLLFNFNVSGEPSLEDVSGGFSMLPAARNPKVTPREGYWDTSYNYSVEIKFDTEIELELWVWDPWYSDWTNQGTAHYSATRKWERIYWNATKPFSEACIGSVSKFKFKYAGIGIKERRDGKLVPLVSAGPRIQTTLPGVEFKTGRVSEEEEATYLDELNYSINVKTNKAVDIELRVYDPCLGMWKSIEIKTAGTGDWKELTWENERPFFDTNCKKGSSKFFFNAYYKGELINKSETYSGPNLIPLIEYRNPKVEPGDGRYNWLFNYSVEIANVTEHVNPEQIKLEVLNPHTLTRTTFNQTGKINNTLMWSVRPFIDDPDCRGTAKYYFVYGDDRWPEVPCYGPEITPPPPPPIELDGWAESTTAERGDLKMEYYVHTGYVTPFNFTASSKDRDVDLELLIRDPETGGLERRGDLQHCYAGGTVTWKYIEPFDSIKEDEIKDYIGQSFDFTFMYGGDIYARDFQGPELVVAFRNPECPTEVIYGEMFNYSIEVIASETLNVTLQYDNGSTWKAVGDRRSYTDRKEWETLTWNCTATEQWQDVRFNWWEEGEGTEMVGTKLEVLQMKDKKSGYPVPLIVTEKK